MVGATAAGYKHDEDKHDEAKHEKYGKDGSYKHKHGKKEHDDEDKYAKGHGYEHKHGKKEYESDSYKHKSGKRGHYGDDEDKYSHEDSYGKHGKHHKQEDKDTPTATAAPVPIPTPGEWLLCAELCDPQSLQCNRPCLHLLFIALLQAASTRDGYVCDMTAHS